MKPIKFHPAAETEMIESVKFYESQQIDLGKRFLEAIQSSIKHIQINPKIYQNIHGNVRRCQTKIFHSALFLENRKNKSKLLQ